jgi:hypothetical protein
MIKYIFFLFIISANSLPQGITNPPAKISRIIETRDGRKSCWGVVIELKDLSFNSTISKNEIRIIDFNHGHDLRDIMSWSVDKYGKKLYIVFKNGCGDFGSGNAVTVIIRATAFMVWKKGNIKLSIPTDI